MSLNLTNQLSEKKLRQANKGLHNLQHTRRKSQTNSTDKQWEAETDRVRVGVMVRVRETATAKGRNSVQRPRPSIPLMVKTHQADVWVCFPVVQ